MKSEWLKEGWLRIVSKVCQTAEEEWEVQDWDA
jgi:hypothetical protein